MLLLFTYEFNTSALACANFTMALDGNDADAAAATCWNDNFPSHSALTPRDAQQRLYSYVVHKRNQPQCEGFD